MIPQPDRADHLADHLVVGGGLAGSMAAMRLAAAGRDVVLLEKESGPHHKVCGEFLSEEAVAYLRRAGVEPLALGAATIRRVRLACRESLAEAQLPFVALSLSRRRLDEAMLSRAAASQCRVIRGAFVEGLSGRTGHWTVHLRGSGSWRANQVFLASGKHDLSGMERESRAHPNPAHGNLIGFKMHWHLAPPQTEALRGTMELFLFNGGYGGLALVENDTADLCLVVSRELLRRIGGWNALIAQIAAENRHMRGRLNNAVPLLEKPAAIFPIPYGYLAPSSDGIWRLGDQAAVIPSFTGDGMSIALHSGALAAQICLAGGTPEDYRLALNRQLRRSMRFASWISRAIVSSPGRALAPLALSLAPGAMHWIARSTRIPQRCLALDPAA